MTMDVETIEKGKPHRISAQLVQTMKSLQLFRQKALFTDVILCAGREELSCHKAILAASSNYFYAMFSSPYKEQQTSRVILDHVSPWALRRLLDFAYLGTLDLSANMVQDVFTAASLLDYPLAIDLCVKFMENHLDVTNCLGIESLAEMHGLINLQRAAHKLAEENFSSILIESMEWINVPLSTVISYISSDNLDVPSEEFVWNACVSWVEQDPEARVAFLPELIDRIRIKYMEPEFLRTQLRDNPLLLESTKAQKQIKIFLETNNNQPGAPNGSENLAPRPATLKKPTLVVLGGLNTCILNCMQSFSPSRTVWKNCPSIPVDSLAWFSVAVVANTLFVIGGIKAGTIMDTVYSYSPIRSLWSQRKSMPEARARHASVGVGNRYIFVFGGLTMTTNSNQLCAMDIINSTTTNNTTTANNNNNNNYNSFLPYSRDNLPNSVINNHNDGRDVPKVDFVHTIIRYDMCGDVWAVVGETEQPRLESHVVVIEDYKSPFGTSNQSVNSESGSDNSYSHSEMPNSADGTISNRPSSTGNRYNSAIPSDRLFVEIGGITESQPQGSDQIVFYRLETDLTAFRTADYIKLPQLIRYVNCSVHQETNLVYIFWEKTSELSVLNLQRHTLRSLAPLRSNSVGHPHNTRIHAGISWVGEKLYVVGGFSEFIGDDRRPTLPRDDVHVYDPSDNTWSRVEVSNNTVPRAIFGCVCLNK